MKILGLRAKPLYPPFSNKPIYSDCLNVLAFKGRYPIPEHPQRRKLGDLSPAGQRLYLDRGKVPRALVETRLGSLVANLIAYGETSESWQTRGRRGRRMVIRINWRSGDLRWTATAIRLHDPTKVILVNLSCSL